MSASTSPLEFREATGLDPAATGDPFVRVRYRYGMLLGADDMTLEQRSHLLRHRLHQAMLHGAGTVWGLGVIAKPIDGRLELIVGAGLALDALGRELYVPRTLCLDLSHVLDNPLLKAKIPTTGGTLRVYVVIRHERAESQPVPAIRPPGALEADAIAYSRVEDRYRVSLELDRPPDPGELLLDWLGRSGPGLEVPSMSSLRDALVHWITGEADHVETLWDAEQEAPLLLASVDLAIGPSAGGRTAVAGADPNNRVRAICPSLPLLFEQLLGQRLSGEDGGVGCRVRDVSLSTQQGALGVDVRFTTSVDGRTVGGARLLALGEQGWARVSAVIPPVTDGLTLRINPSEAVASGARVQVLIPGQGEGPVLSADGAPLGGWWDDPLPASGRGLDVSWVGVWSEVVS